MQLWQLLSCWSWRVCLPSCTPCVCTGKLKSNVLIFAWSGDRIVCVHPDNALGRGTFANLVSHTACSQQQSFGECFPCQELMLLFSYSVRSSDSVFFVWKESCWWCWRQNMQITRPTNNHHHLTKVIFASSVNNESLEDRRVTESYRFLPVFANGPRVFHRFIHMCHGLLFQGGVPEQVLRRYRSQISAIRPQQWWWHGVNAITHFCSSFYLGIGIFCSSNLQSFEMLKCSSLWYSYAHFTQSRVMKRRHPAALYRTTWW